MKKFVFSLQGVLDIKRKLEGQAKVNFGVARARLNAEEEKRDAIAARRDGYRDELSAAMSGRLDVTKIKRCEDAIDVLEESLAAQEMAVNRAEKQVELMRNRLNAVVMERKTIEKLREKKFAEYMKEYDAEERKAIDELTSYRHSQPDEDAAQGAQ